MMRTKLRAWKRASHYCTNSADVLLSCYYTCRLHACSSDCVIQRWDRGVIKGTSCILSMIQGLGLITIFLSKDNYSAAYSDTPHIPRGLRNETEQELAVQASAWGRLALATYFHSKRGDCSVENIQQGSVHFDNSEGSGKVSTNAKICMYKIM